MKTRVVGVRLPEDHWLWAERNRIETVRRALDFYRDYRKLCQQMADEMADLRRAVTVLEREFAELKKLLEEGEFSRTRTCNRPDGSELDPRLARATDKLLNLW